MLEELLNSKTRVKILTLFFADERRDYYAQEVVQQTKVDPANVHRELTKLVKLGVLRVKPKGRQKFYALNADSPYHRGLRELFTAYRSASQADSYETLLPMLGPLPRNQRPLINGKEWYHQRFDGSPLFLVAVGEGELRLEARKPAGTEANVRVCYFDQEKADWYLDMNDVRRGAAVITKLASSDPSTSKRLLAAWKDDEAAFDRFFTEEFPGFNFRAMSDKEFIDLWNRYYGLAVRRFTSSAIIDHFALGTDEQLRNLLRREVYARQSGKTLQEREFTEIFSTATAPVHQSFINQAEIDLLKIALGQSPETLEAHQHRYFWITNNYVRSEVLPVSYFKRELRAWKLSKKNLVHELKKLEKTPRLNRERKQQLFRRFSFSPRLRALITVSEDFTWWQDERKKATYVNIYMGTKLLEEVARRTGYEVENLKYCIASEVASVLREHQPTRRELRQRRQRSVVVMSRQGCYVSTGRDVDSIYRSMLGSRKLHDVQDIRGLSASLGRAVGTVKVVGSATEINKVQEGDILVAVMTRPDYVPAMRRAAAVVTNEGGITSHAAIVSRELGIPCIIGTKIATQVFQDGDMVEVNANHGWVRKVGG